MSEHTEGYCGQHHSFYSLQRDCPGCAAEELARECPLCTEKVLPDEEGFLDCSNCGAHLEDK